MKLLDKHQVEMVEELSNDLTNYDKSGQIFAIAEECLRAMTVAALEEEQHLIDDKNMKRASYI